MFTSYNFPALSSPTLCYPKLTHLPAAVAKMVRQADTRRAPVIVSYMPFLSPNSQGILLASYRILNTYIPKEVMQILHRLLVKRLLA
jgi:hypothetical protein